MKKLLLLITFLFSIASFAHAQETVNPYKTVTFDIVDGGVYGGALSYQKMYIDGKTLINGDVSIYLQSKNNYGWYYNIYAIHLHSNNDPICKITAKENIITNVTIFGEIDFHYNKPSSQDVYKSWDVYEKEVTLDNKYFNNDLTIYKIEVTYLEKNDSDVDTEISFSSDKIYLELNKSLDLKEILQVSPPDALSHIKFTSSETSGEYITISDEGVIKAKDRISENPIMIMASIPANDDTYKPNFATIALYLIDNNPEITIKFKSVNTKNLTPLTSDIDLPEFIESGIDYIKSIEEANKVYCKIEEGVQFGVDDSSTQCNLKIILSDNIAGKIIESVSLNCGTSKADMKILVNGIEKTFPNISMSYNNEIFDLSELNDNNSGFIEIVKEGEGRFYLQSLTIHFADINEPTDPEKVVLNLFEAGQEFVIENDHAYVYSPSVEEITTGIALSVTNTNFDVDEDLDILIKPFGWSADSEAKVLLKPDDKGAFNLSLQDIKSSGLYRVSFQSNNDKYVLAEPCSFTLNLYPSISGLMFVDGDYSYSAEGNVPYQFLYSEDENGEEHPDWLIDSRVAPVVELSEKNVEIWYKIEDSNSNGDNEEENTLRRLPADSELATMYFDKVDDENRINLRPIAENNDTNASYQINFVLKKNGASSPVDSDGNTTHFISFPSTNEPTGIDAISTDDAEAVYFNLQGVKVARPERGIFIRVAGNKAEKVIL